jgi:hypothetical protein
MTTFHATFSIGFDAVSDSALANAAKQKIFQTFPQVDRDAWTDLQINGNPMPTEPQIQAAVSQLLDKHGLDINTALNSVRYAFYDNEQRCIHCYPVVHKGTGAPFEAGPVNGQTLQYMCQLEWHQTAVVPTQTTTTSSMKAND